MTDILLLYLSLQKVETQNFASHKQEWEINWGEDMTVIVAFVVRETQDFASLQADAIVIA